MEKVNRIFSENLKRRREALHLSQKEIAQRLDISEVAYRNYESGRSLPRDGHLADLLSALNVSMMDLAREFVRPRAIYFRTKEARTRCDTATGMLAIEKGMRKISDYCYLEQDVGGGCGFDLRTIRMDVSGSAERTGEVVMLACKVRGELFGASRFDGDELVAVLESRGVKVIAFPFGNAITAGFSVGEEDGGPAIVVNDSPDITPERKLFTIAHELGHLLMHFGSYSMDLQSENKVQEREANLFAAELLMPTEDFDRFWEDNAGYSWLSRVMRAKKYFNVSYKTVLYRLSRRGGEDYGRLQARFFSAYGLPLGGKEEPLPMEFFLRPARFRHLVRLAYDKGRISVSRLGELLEKDAASARRLVEGWECEG